MGGTCVARRRRRRRRRLRLRLGSLSDVAVVINWGRRQGMAGRRKIGRRGRSLHTTGPGN
jgi:hypothetical protein